MISTQQLRMARAALNVSQQIVADSIGIGVMALGDIEKEKTKNPKASTIDALKEFYENAGLEFTEAGGVRPNDAEIKIYKGVVGFQNFYNDIYKVTKAGGNISIQNGMPDYLIKFLGQDFYDMHLTRMVKLKPSVRVLVKKYDSNLIGSAFAEYRSVSEDKFNDQTIYIYGEKIGFITFNGDYVEVKVLDIADITRSLKISFDIIWRQANEIS